MKPLTWKPGCCSCRPGERHGPWAGASRREDRHADWSRTPRPTWPKRGSGDRSPQELAGWGWGLPAFVSPDPHSDARLRLWTLPVPLWTPVLCLALFRAHRVKHFGLFCSDVCVPFHPSEGSPLTAFPASTCHTWGRRGAVTAILMTEVPADWWREPWVWRWAACSAVPLTGLAPSALCPLPPRGLLLSCVKH